MKLTTLYAPKNITAANKEAKKVVEMLNAVARSKGAKQDKARLEDKTEGNKTTLTVFLKMPNKTELNVWEWEDTGFELKQLRYNDDLITRG